MILKENIWYNDQLKRNTYTKEEQTNMKKRADFIISGIENNKFDVEKIKDLLIRMYNVGNSARFKNKDIFYEQVNTCIEWFDSSKIVGIGGAVNMSRSQQAYISKIREEEDFLNCKIIKVNDKNIFFIIIDNPTYEAEIKYTEIHLESLEEGDEYFEICIFGKDEEEEVKEQIGSNKIVANISKENRNDY